MAQLEVIALDTAVPQLRAPGGSDTYLMPKDLTIQGTVTVDSGATINGGAVFNETGADVDFRIESDTNADAFALDGTNGSVGIGTAPVAVAKVIMGGTLPSSGAASQGFRSIGQIPSATTSNYIGFFSFPTTEAASFTLTGLRHFSAGAQAFGAGSAVTSQYGFEVANSLTGATNNFGFYSNIASGSNRWNFYANGTADNYFGGPTTISVNSSSAALRVTQTGTGNALLVEDASGDASPFVINASGNTIVGFSSAIATRVATFSLTPVMQVFDGGVGGFSTFRFSGASASPATQFFAKSRSGTVGTTGTVVVDGDGLMRISAAGDDGTQFTEAGRIDIQVDGTPGTNDMPGRLTFSTTADGSATPTEKMRIDNAGNVVVNTAAIATTATNGFLYVPSCAGTPTGTPTTYTGRVPIVVDTTNNKLYFYSNGTWRDAGP